MEDVNTSVPVDQEAPAQEASATTETPTPAPTGDAEQTA